MKKRVFHVIVLQSDEDEVLTITYVKPHTGNEMASYFRRSSWNRGGSTWHVMGFMAEEGGAIYGPECC